MHIRFFLIIVAALLLCEVQSLTSSSKLVKRHHHHHHRHHHHQQQRPHYESVHQQRGPNKLGTHVTSSNYTQNRPDPSHFQGTELKQCLQAKGVTYFGGALGQEDINDSNLMQCVKNYNILTPTNELKMRSTYTDVSQFQEIQQKVQKVSQWIKYRFHTLIWHNSIASQVQQTMSRGQDPTPMIEVWFRNVLVPKLGKDRDIVMIDALNEIFADDGSGFKNTEFQKTLGNGYEGVLKLVRKYFPQWPVYVNEYGIECPGKKQDFALSVLSKWRKQGLINGVGLQAHFTSDQFCINKFEQTIARFQEADLDVYITELDVAVPNSASQEDLVQQANDFAAIFKAAVNRRVSGITLWSLDNDNSWITRGVACNYASNLCNKRNPSVFDSGCKPNLAYATIMQALEC